MLTRQRKDHILAVLRRDGQIIAKQLGMALGLSEDTIRRDLRELAAEGKLQRVHGGALPMSPAIGDMTTRGSINPDAKRAIGQAAARLVSPGQIVFLDGGTSTEQLARHLPTTLEATVVTHSPSIAVALARHPAIEVVLIGGRLFKHSIVTVGAAALAAIAGVQPDIFFMGATGVHAARGITTADFEESAIKRAILDRSAETVLLASPEKFGAVSPFLIAPLDRLSGIVVEETPPAAFVRACRTAKVTITRAGA